MNVTFLNPAAGLGGAERCLLDMIVAVRAADPRLKPSVILLTDGPLVGLLGRSAVPTTVLQMPESLATLGDSAARSFGGFAALSARLLAGTPAGAAFVRKLAALTGASSPQVVHSNGIKTHLLTRLVVPSGCATVCHLHDFIGSRPAAASLLATCVPSDSCFVANSQAVADDARKVVGNSSAVHTIYNSIDTDVFSPREVDGGWLDAVGGAAEPDRPVVRVGLVSTYARWKGHEVFIRALSRLPGTVRAAARFYVVGGPIYETSGSQWSLESLRQMARTAGVEGELVFVPFQEDAARVMQSLDLVVHASTQPEPFGRTIVEAMACGRAVVVSRAGGSAELFEPGTHALGFPPGDDAALAGAVSALITNPDLRRKLGEAARPHVVQSFGLDRLGQQLSLLYRTATRGRM